MKPRDSYLADRAARRQRRVTAGLLAASALATVGLWVLNAVAEGASVRVAPQSLASPAGAGRIDAPSVAEPYARVAASGDQP